jgi:hypothetical protein
MRRRREREQELRHAELRTLSMAARREERSGAVSLDADAIARIRATVDTEMPLEYVMPEYLDRETDVSIDAEGRIGGIGQQPADPAAPHHETAGQAAVTPAPTAAEVPPETGAAAPTTSAPTPAGDTAPDTGTSAPAGASVATAAAVGGAAVALGAMTTEVATGNAEQSDERDLAGRVFESASDLDLERLARRLYGRFRRDLRRELLIDRERAGTLADVC